jgi:hypothetical protein
MPAEIMLLAAVIMGRNAEFFTETAQFVFTVPLTGHLQQFFH